MKILMAASEMAPLARTGEFADEMLALAAHLREAGHEVSVAMPYYRCVREDKQVNAKRTKIKFSVPVGPAKLPAEIFEAMAPGGVRVFLVARDEFFDRTGLYGAGDRDYQDNSARFIFFTKCALELAKKTGPDVVHVHGWQTALLPVFAKDQRLPVATVLTPHSLEFQGNFWSYDFALTNLPGEYFSARGLEFYGSMNCLKAGILFADAVVLPGRRHVAEMQTPEFGCGLEAVLREQNYKLEGIPDGLKESAWPVFPAAENPRRGTSCSSARACCPAGVSSSPIPRPRMARESGSCLKRSTACPRRTCGFSCSGLSIPPTGRLSKSRRGGTPGGSPTSPMWTPHFSISPSPARNS